LKCYDIYKKVEPLKIKAEKMRKAKEAGEKKLAETEQNLAALNPKRNTDVEMDFERVL